MRRHKQRTISSDLLRHLSNLGSPVVIPRTEEKTDLDLYQVGSVGGAQALELQDRRVCYIFEVHVVNQRSTPVFCENLELHLPWSDPDFGWLPDPRRHGRNASYVFDGRGAPLIPHAEVLNPRLLSKELGVLMPYVPYEGFLLGLGKNMPQDLYPGQEVDATLTLLTSDRSEYTADITLLAERAFDGSGKGRIDQVISAQTEAGEDEHARDLQRRRSLYR